MCLARGVWVAGWLFLPCLTLPAAPPEAPAGNVGQLIAQLGDEKFAQRTQAMEGLEKLGPAVLPQLHEALAKPADPEVRRRLDEIIARLETAGALKPTRITLKMVDQPVRKVVEEIGRQAGYKLEMNPPMANDERDKRLISLELTNATFWTALQQVCELGGLVLQEGWYGNDNLTLRLQAADAFPGYLCLEGPFRVVARNMTYYRNLDLGGLARVQTPDQRRNEQLSLNLSISVEPRLPLYGVGQPILQEAIDDLDQSLKLPLQQNQLAARQAYYSGYRGYMQQVTCGLNPMANGRRIKLLKGTIPVTLIALQRPKITVEKLSEAGKQTFKAGTTTLFLEEVTKNGNQLTLKLNISEATKGGAQDYNWVNTVVQRIEVQDEKGQKLQSFSSSWGMSGNSVQGTFTYGGNGANGMPTKLIYFDWITISHEVPFEFRDLPLP